MFNLSVCAETVLTDLPFVERMKEIARAGFQVEEGNLVGLICNYHEFIGYVHAADVPGRHEPGTGEINYPQVAQALREVGCEGTIGLEAFPQHNGHQAIARFREIFT